MKFIYDVLLNFKDKYYDFYDWNKNDNIIHVRKIPLIKIEEKDIINLIKYKIKFNEEFIKNIEDKTEIFTNKGIKKLDYCCLFSDGNIVIAVEIKQNKYKISSLLIDEELDALEDVFRQDTQDISYDIITKNDICLKTRKQIEKQKYVKKYLKKIKDIDKIKYLYYECFDKKENNVDKIVIELNSIDDEKIIDKIYKVLKLIEIHK